MDIFRHANPRILVVGDIMLDHNITAKISKIANEAPIAVFEEQTDEYKLGGCANVLQNLVNMGADATIIGCVGSDKYGDIVHNLINKLRVDNRIITLENHKTTTKTRYFSEQKLVFRSDYETNCNISINKWKYIVDNVLCKSYDCIIFSDYNKGFLTKELCQYIINIANQRGIITCVDPKYDYTKYIGCTMIKPNRKEAYELYTIPVETNAEDTLRIIRQKTECVYSVMTLAEEGIVLFDGEYMHRQSPTMKYTIIDVTGAGDVVCSILGYFLPLRIDISRILYIATNLATLSIEHPGVYSISRIDVERLFIQKHIQFTELSKIRLLYPDRSITFTNGCFDLVHKGHMDLLKFCAINNSVVVVGLNSDESIRRFKGLTRPIHTLENRLAILEANQYVHHIVIFEEDTPFHVLEALKPDRLVKGGDYTIDQIVGREHAKEVVRFDLVPDISTTRIIQKITDTAKPH